MTEMMELANKKNVQMIIVNTFHMFKKAYLKEMEPGPWRDICAPMFLGAHSQGMETTEVSVDRWMDKEKTVNINYEISFSLKK